MIFILLLLGAVTMSSIGMECQMSEEDYYISEDIQSTHFDERRDGSKIKHLVMHYTVATFNRTIDIFTGETRLVSSHYVITEEESEAGIQGGKIYRLVPEEKRAWHAGKSYWCGEEELNHTSIGIENVNPGFKETSNGREWFKFDSSQIKSLGKLSRSIVKKYNISPVNVVGHADIAPDRKSDPGPFFPWGELYKEYGVGAWLDNADEQYINEQYNPSEKLSQVLSVPACLARLKKIGFKVDDSGHLTPENQDVVKSFQAHYSKNQQPDKCTGTIDENDMRLAWGLEAKYRNY